jgi:hypothetical protein
MGRFSATSPEVTSTERITRALPPSTTLPPAPLSTFIHPSVWKAHSPNFGRRGFLEVRTEPVPCR